MGFLKKLVGSKDDEPMAAEQGLLIYDSVNDVIQAEATLKKAAFDSIKVVAPPPQYRSGCDLSIQFPIIERMAIVRALENSKNPPTDILHLNEELMQSDGIHPNAAAQPLLLDNAWPIIVEALAE